MTELSWMAKLRELMAKRPVTSDVILTEFIAYGEECERQIDKDMVNQRLLEEHIAIEKYEKEKNIGKRRKNC